jgi:hypothetical protein
MASFLQVSPFWQSVDKSDRTVVLSLTIAAFVLRLTAFFLFQEQPGDGPSRAMLAYMWSMSPVFRPHTAWLPGYMYLTGAFDMVVNDPLVSTRILNLLFGTLTVPIFYLLIRRIFDHISALLCAILLVVFPLHISLSVTSLTEISFLLEIIAGTLLVLQATVTAGWRRHVGLILSIFVFGLASLTRYEVWILLPLFPTYYFLKTGRFYQSLFLTIGLALFPTVWMVASFLGTGSFLPIYEAALFKTGGGTDLPGALKIIARLSINHLGWIIPLLTAVGLLLLFMDAAKRQLSKERLLYLAIVLVTGLFIVKFGMDRGLTMHTRYLLLIFVMSFPFCTFVISRYLNLRIKPYFIILAVFLVAAPPFVSQVVNKHDLYVTRKTAPGVETLGRWLADSPFRDSPLLLTKMGWVSTYLPLYRPEIAFRYIIVSDWLNDTHLRDFLSTFQPQLLITSDGEHKYISRIEKLIGAQIHEDRLVYVQDTYKAYDLRGLSKLTKYSTVPINRSLIVGPGFLGMPSPPGNREPDAIADHHFNKETHGGR